MIYLAGPIDYTPLSSGANNWRWRAKNLIHEPCFDPYAAFNPAPRVHTGIGKINNEALRLSDAVLALGSPTAVTVGTWMEVERAAAMGKPVVVFWDRGSVGIHSSVSVMLRERENVEVVEDFVKACAIVQDRADQARLEDRELGLKVVLADTGVPPVRAYESDVGYDLYVQNNHRLIGGGFKDISCGVDQVELPPGYWGLITSRSSTWRDKRLVVLQGVIDPGYRGPLLVGVHNASNEQVQIDAGERLAQLILIPVAQGVPVKEVEPWALSKSERGGKGFGSTGA